MLIVPQPWVPGDVYSGLGITNIDELDMQKALNSAADIVFSDRGRAQQMLNTTHFQTWLLIPSSARLLVHGDFDSTTRTSPFTVLCATMTYGFRNPPELISLAFFCGYHLFGDKYKGGLAMIRSLIAQLLRQYPYATIIPSPELHMYDIGSASIGQLCRLFDYIIGSLPSGTTVFCLIDGIDEYERDDYLHTMDQVVLALMDLVSHGSYARFKLLLTSPRPTREVRKAFDDEPSTLLHMQQLPIVEDCIESNVLQQQLQTTVESRVQDTLH
jgi:hypothetical protein